MTISAAQCRSCGSTDLLSFPGRVEAAFCATCSLVQRTTDDLVTTPSTASHTWQDGPSLTKHLIQSRNLGKESFVIEASCSDGSLLQSYRDAGIPVLGIESSRESARIARQRHEILTRDAVFSRALADRLRAQDLRCDVFHARDALSTSVDLKDFFRGVRQVLRDDGIAVFETPWIVGAHRRADDVSALLSNHRYSFSLTALHHGLTACGLVVVDVVQVPAATTLLQIHVVPALPGIRQGSRVASLLATESSWGVNQPSTYGLSRRLEAA